MKGSDRNSFVICDKEKAYVTAFTDYLHARRAPVPEPRVFTSYPELCAYAQGHPVGLLLVSERTADAGVLDIPAEKVILLSEGEERPGFEELPRVDKYQAADRVLREVMDLYEAEKLIRRSREPDGKKRVIGVISPAGCPQKLFFCLAAGQLLAAGHRVLFLPLDLFDGLSVFLGQDAEEDLGDLLYIYRQQRNRFISRAAGMTQPLRQLDLLPPAGSPSDLLALSGGEWADLLNSILAQGGYEALVLDLGLGLRDEEEILALCTDIFLLTGPDALSRARDQQFESLLAAQGREALFLKMKKVTPPVLSGFGTGRLFLESLTGTALGRFVREHL